MDKQTHKTAMDKYYVGSELTWTALINGWNPSRRSIFNLEARSCYPHASIMDFMSPRIELRSHFDKGSSIWHHKRSFIVLRCITSTISSSTTYSPPSSAPNQRRMLLVTSNPAEEARPPPVGIRGNLRRWTTSNCLVPG